MKHTKWWSFLARTQLKDIMNLQIMKNISKLLNGLQPIETVTNGLICLTAQLLILTMNEILFMIAKNILV